ncbi:MAG TPA: hypothetical protein VFX80_11710 [Solirubrobacteraceae bacterium]|nr:hypothetical protein [Solirubrobacteraceae bacterium]
MGWNREVGLDEVRGWMRTQDSAAMLGALHELPVQAGDVVYVPAGTAHAIGEGILMVELQEPSDMSVVLEWEGFELREADSHLGLGWDRALEALDLSAAEPPGTTLPPESEAFFRAERVHGGDSLDPGFSVLVGLAGSGTLATEGGELDLARGTVVLLPYAAGPGELRGELEVLRARPAA